MYIVCLFGRVRGFFDDKLDAERYRTRLSAELYMNDTAVRIFALDNCPKTELLTVNKNYHFKGYLLDEAVSVVRDHCRFSLRDDEDLPFD